MSQINLRLPETLRKKAEKHVKENGYRNIQELATEALREKMQEETFSRREIQLIEQLVDVSLKKNLLVNADTAFKKARSRRKQH